MPTLDLNVKLIDGLKTPEKRTEYFDAAVPGLCLRITENGHKSWGLYYRFAGRQQRLSLGNYVAVSLKEARKKAGSALRDIEHGINPAVKRAEDRKADTFEQLAADFMERYSKAKKRSWKEDQRIIDNKLNPRIGSIRAKDVTRAQVREILESIAKTAPIEANRVLACTRKIYNWAISVDLVESNPCDHIPAPGKENRRDRVLSADEIKILWKAFGEEQLPVASAFKLRLLTAQRGGEVHSIEWKDLELDNAWWEIPAGKAKNNLAHRVPLTAPALRIFEDLRKKQDNSKTRRDSAWVFPARRFEGDNDHLGTVQKAVERIRERTGIQDFKPHDLRRTAASLMTEMGISRLVVQKILNHKEAGVTAVYDRYSYTREKREALEAWAKRLMLIVSDLREVKTEA